MAASAPTITWNAMGEGVERASGTLRMVVKRPLAVVRAVISVIQQMCGRVAEFKENPELMIVPDSGFNMDPLNAARPKLTGKEVRELYERLTNLVRPHLLSVISETELSLDLDDDLFMAIMSAQVITSYCSVCRPTPVDTPKDVFVFRCHCENHEYVMLRPCGHVLCNMCYAYHGGLMLSLMGKQAADEEAKCPMCKQITNRAFLLKGVRVTTPVLCHKIVAEVGNALVE
jgi:hypothetical protein